MNLRLNVDGLACGLSREIEKLLYIYYLNPLSVLGGINLSGLPTSRGGVFIDVYLSLHPVSNCVSMFPTTFSVS